MKAKAWWAMAWFNGLAGSFWLGAMASAWAFAMMDKVPEPVLWSRGTVLGVMGLVGALCAASVANGKRIKEEFPQ